MVSASVSLEKRVLDSLEPLLGRHTAKHAMRHVSARLGKEPEEMSAHDLPGVQEVLTPILRTLLGQEVTSRVLRDLGEE